MLFLLASRAIIYKLLLVLTLPLLYLQLSTVIWCSLSDQQVRFSFVFYLSIITYCFDLISGHSRNSSLELRVGLSGSCSRSSQDLRGLANRVPPAPGHSRAASLDLRHARNSSADLNKLFRNDLGLVFGTHSKFYYFQFVLNDLCSYFSF